MEELYAKIKTELKSRPKELTSLDRWLFVVINTAKSIIDNTHKDCLDMADKLADCDSTGQIQYEFDQIQGKFGREGFSQRYSPNYLYLCSLVANFPNQTLSSKEQELIIQYCAVKTYLLYEL
ncbi:MAG: hypothetical protein K2N06_04570 [Oscillospiraceae bacterium]|nr:hypothetical protein [Oscillospiraceae bacterium]